MENTEDLYKGFKGELWKKEINVSDFIDNNYKEYKGDDSFLVGTTKKTNKVWQKCEKLLALERKKGLLDVDLEHFSGINTIPAGYIDKKNEVIFGLQSDKPLKRLVNPYGGIRMVKGALGSYGKEMNDQMKFIFENHIRKTHNDGVFDAYSTDIRKARSAGLLTGLPDAYGRGRIIGDYRRVALYGIDRLIEEKKNELISAPYLEITDEESIRLREEVSEQIRALEAMKDMAKGYGFDI